jgi:hypothetical protein
MAEVLVAREETQGSASLLDKVKRFITDIF